MRKLLFRHLEPHFKPLLGYIAATFVFLFPAFTNINSGLWGFRGDNFMVIWTLWIRSFAWLHGIDQNFTYFVAYPFGESIKPISQEYLVNLPLQLLILLVGPFASFNLFNIVSFILSGFTAYLFALYLTKHKLGSFVAGLIFTLSPYHFWQSYAHFALAALYFIPLYYLVLFHYWKEPTIKKGLLLGVLFAANFYTSFYYGFFNAIVTGVLLLLFCAPRLLGFARRKFEDYDKKFILGLVSCGALAAALIIPTYVAFNPGSSESGSSVEVGFFKRDINELFGLSARPWDYLMPAPNHPLFGDWSYEMYLRIKSIDTDYFFTSAFLPERVNYLGITTIVFSLIGLLYAWRHNQRTLALILGILLVVLVLFTMPPIFYIKGKPLYLPSYFTYKLVAFVRVYARLGIYVLLFMLPLFVWGYAYLEKWFETYVKKIIIITKPHMLFAFLVGLLILIEFINFPPYYFTNMKSKDHYDFIKSQPGDFGIVEYPKNFDIAKDVIAQFYHGKRLFNMNASNPYFSIYDSLDLLNDGLAPAIMHDFNIRYLVLHTYGEYHPIDETWMRRFATEYPTNPPGSELETVFEDGEAVIYQFKPKVPAKVVVIRDDPRIPEVTIPSGSTWNIKDQTNLIFINTTNQKRTASCSFKLAGNQSDAAFVLAGGEADIRNYFSKTVQLSFGQKQEKTVIPLQVLSPLQEVTLLDFTCKIVKETNPPSPPV